MLNRTSGIVLRTIKHGESDLIVHVISKLGCRMNLMAKGAMRSRRRFGGGVLQAINYINFTYKQKKSNSEAGLYWLEEASMENDFPGLRTDYHRLEMALYFLQVVSKIGREEIEDSRELFNLLGNSLNALQNSSQIFTLKTQFQIKILKEQGVLPTELIESEFLIRSVKDHESIQLSDDQVNSIYRQSQYALTHYLNENGRPLETSMSRG